MQLISLLFLLILGALIGLSALWILRRHRRPNYYRRLIGLTAFLTFDLIVFGGFTRLTDSGLGCPDWPGCYAQASPFHAQEWIAQAEAQQPTGPVTLIKAWIEMLHRYLAMSVGLLIICIMLLAWRRRQQASPWLATALFGLVCVQGAFGAWTVTLKLQPLIVTLHLLFGLILFAGLICLYSRQTSNALLNNTPTINKRLSYWAIISLVVLFLQIALGGWVSTNYAVLACVDFPLCHGQWLPEMDFAQGFTLWRELGKNAQGNMITMPALIAIHWLHRTFAVIVLLVMARLIYLLKQCSALRHLAYGLAAGLGLQIITGIANIILQWPLISAVIHNAGAALLVFLLTRINYDVRT